MSRYDDWLVSTIPDGPGSDEYLEARGWVWIGKRNGANIYRFRNLEGSCLIKTEDEAMEIQEREDQERFAYDRRAY